MKRRNLLPLLAATLATAIVPAVAPAAQPKKPMGDVRGQIEATADGTMATVRVTYRCNASDHLWVSLKQTASGKKDWALRGEGSSQLAATWLQSHRNPFTCDGTKRTAAFVVDLVEPGSKGALVKGQAYLQWCLTTPAGELEVYKTKFLWVHLGGMEGGGGGEGPILT